MEVIINKDGYKELIVLETYKLLSEYFQMDVQSAGGVYELNLLNQFRNNGLDYQEIGVGNAFDLTFRKDSVSIENVFTDEILRDIPIAFYEKCLIEWINKK
ncbi:hypothetical protein HXZ94_07380 [Empedobacter falsenii]|nr:hypothetical protein [Empedobacter falsenii]MDM1298322.1 hypothetical protein [Empedobacter falsenii]MDM1318121.1 hypothetical protein [Empedobacter falsenii]